MADWKDKVNGYCPCFTGGDNKLGLKKNNEVCQCNANEFKFMLLSDKEIDKVSITACFIKFGVFTKSEIIQGVAELTKRTPYMHYTKRAANKLRKLGYVVFYTSDRIIKAYEKEKV